jgi:hypothetical protein
MHDGEALMYSHGTKTFDEAAKSALAFEDRDRTAEAERWLAILAIPTRGTKWD